VGPRDDSIPQPEISRPAGTACDGIDALLLELHRIREQLVSEVRASDDAATVRADAIIERLRRGAGTEASRAAAPPVTVPLAREPGIEAEQ
jgi:hypothetical protein